jgi:hypothetical protein
MKTQKFEWLSGCFKQWRWNFDLLVNVTVYTLGKNLFGGLQSKGVHFNAFKSDGLHEKHAVATCKLGTFSAFT